MHDDNNLDSETSRALSFQMTTVLERRDRQKQISDIIFMPESNNLKYNLYDRDDIFELDEYI